ncbi:MAG TPA: hypothetical protein VM074_12420 [Solimonas sp.]|nr:hypothetical protein [Solimonas sp.]
MFSIDSCCLPDGALLAAYRRQGDYTDCFATGIARAVTHGEYVAAFYTTTVFKLERLILNWAVARPSTDNQAQLLGAGAVDRFAAWHVEERSDNQLLMCDFMGRTRSWLMIEPLGNAETRLYFGSAVVAKGPPRSGKPALGAGFSATLGLHRFYSQVLLRAAKARLEN